MSWTYEKRDWKPFLRFWERRLVIRYWRGVEWDESYDYRLKRR